MKLANNSDGEPYECKCEWPDNCFVQCGDLGVVLCEKGNYETAFFEAFTKEPKTFIRGEGPNIEEAELNAWNQYQKFIKCKTHEFERKYYRNGSGICKNCGMFSSNVFEPAVHCKICGKPTYYTHDINDDWYCEEHKHLIPEELETGIHKMLKGFKKLREEEGLKNAER